jgi:putative ABC transport system ATP-binding protein
MRDIIKIENLSKIYRIGQERVVALKDINLEIKEGEICCILGTSGSGKSTLLNMIAGLEKPTKGHIIIKNVFKIEAMNENRLTKFRQENVGFIFQSYNLMDSLTARENVAMPLVFRGVSKRARNKRAVQMLDNVGLLTHIRHRPTQMSGGQQQRVGIARAFVGKPEIVFADEPTGNLDSKTGKEVMDLMVSLIKKNGKTMVMVTHDHRLSLYADKVVKISDGQIEEIVIHNQEFFAGMQQGGGAVAVAGDTQ